MNITQAPNGASLVIETKKRVYFGRLRRVRGEEVVLKDASYDEVDTGKAREQLIQERAKFGFPPAFENLILDEQEVERVRRLGEIRKN